MKILLIQPPHYYGGRNRPPSFFPLGLGYLSKVLLNSGHEVEIFDIWAHQYKNKEVKEKIKRLKYDIVGISALSTQYAYVKWLTSELKKHSNAPIVVGNALATYSPEIVLKHTKTDICCIGEGEITLKEIIENINKLEKVKGIYFKKGNKIIKNQLREYIKDLDSIPFPAWDLFPMDIYLKNCRLWGGLITAMNLITTRGCPYNCKFCSKTFREIRLRSAENVIKEIKTLKDKYGIEGIFFSEELLVINKARTIAICEKIKKLKMKWVCQGRVNLVNLELLKCMKNAGCIVVGYGIESGSQIILDNMNKMVTVEQAEMAIKNTIKAGMNPMIQMMYGYPGETKETLQETISFFKRCPYLGPQGIANAVKFSPITPLPGSELYEQVVKNGLIKNEEEYLYSLEGGFMPDGTRTLVNFTNFSEKRFYAVMKRVEKQIYRNQLKSHFLRFMKDYSIMYFRILLTSFRVHGYKRTIKKVMQMVVLNSFRIIRNKRKDD